MPWSAIEAALADHDCDLFGFGLPCVLTEVTWHKSPAMSFADEEEIKRMRAYLETDEFVYLAVSAKNLR